jgi:hypothetical protein
MLPDRLSELLTSYVDGELSPRQRKTVLRLLRKSHQARVLLRQLRHDARAVGSLPRQTLHPDFSLQVLQAITRRGLRPPRLARLQAQRPPAWIGWTTAAAVFLAVSAASFLFFSSRHGPNSDAADTAILAASQKNLPAAPKVNPEAPAPIGHENGSQPPTNPNKQNQPSPLPGPKKADGNLDEMWAKIFPSPEKKKLGPGDPPPSVVAIDTGANPEKMFSIENPKLSLYLSFRRLQEKEVRGDLFRRLQAEKSCRLQLFCRDNGKAVERLKNALKNNGVQLMIDPYAQAALKKSSKSTRFVLYSENLTSAELSQVLDQLSNEDRAAEQKRKGEGQFGDLIVSALAENNRLALARMLGVDVKELRAPKKKPAENSLRVPLSKVTEEQIFLSLQGQGPSRLDQGHPRPQSLAMLLVYHENEALRHGNSKEIKNFLLARAGRPGTLQVVLVLQQGPVS